MDKHRRINKWKYVICTLLRSHILVVITVDTQVAVRTIQMNNSYFFSIEIKFLLLSNKLRSLYFFSMEFVCSVLVSLTFSPCQLMNKCCKAKSSYTFRDVIVFLLLKTPIMTLKCSHNLCVNII
jgi:hypothetical protein